MLSLSKHGDLKLSPFDRLRVRIWDVKV